MATILEELNKLSGALGGAETATENLEALNAIAGALGGETNATNNADAIDQIAEHASGGGGSSDFSTVEVTITNNSVLNNAIALVPIRADDSGMSYAAFSFEIAGGTHETVNVILCQDAAICSIDISSPVNITATGSIEVVPGTELCQITGSGTITIIDSQ